MDKRILIVAEELHERLNDPDWIAVDCRFDLADTGAGRRSYEESHLPGAVFLDLDEDLAGPTGPSTGRHPIPAVESITARLGELGVGNSSKIVVYDGSHGAIAARAWWILHWLGHDEVFLLDGGFARWQSLGLRCEAETVSRPAADFHARPRPELILKTHELAAHDGRVATMNLLDARDATRFRGEAEPIDPVAGHVPGARNAPFGDFVNPDGTWLTLDERKALLNSVLDDDRSPWSVMCGSGVTACHLAISGLEAGLVEPRVYVGSWSEWIRDPGRPIGLGEA